VEYRFNVIAVGIQDKGGVIAGMIQPVTRFIIVASAF